MAGIRALERQRAALDALGTALDTATAQLAQLAYNPEDQRAVDTGSAALQLQHAKRLKALLRRCHGTFAVDPGVRRLRTRTCDAITFNRVGSHEAVDRALRGERRQWRLDPGKPVEVAALTAAEPAKAALQVLADEPLGVRLLLLQGRTLMVVDVDANTTTVLTDEAFDAVASRTWAAVDRGGELCAYSPDQPTAPRCLPVEGQGLVASPDTDTVWVGNENGSVEYDRSATPVGAAFDSAGETLMAATDTYLVTSLLHDPNPDGTPPEQHLTLWDRRTRRVVRTLPDAWLASARHGVVVWTDPGTGLHATDPAFVFRSVSPPEAVAVVNPQGTLVATVGPRDSVLTVVGRDPDPQKNPALRVDGYTSEIAWRPDGRLLFASGDRLRYFDSALRGRVLRMDARTMRLVGAL